ncbi:uncharacterized protein BYT42DRAFT_615321 [Radiomyces spectabilis]|uniref:uncharacterized protein n=1 Tax=Radiomyces spectabilis TaxID=64574 RepID=UPI002220C297|nr:uncharacterized protein BYT42DRAFT_615321 [Radiomyces spectabilis]KAI8374129.1 hypothetical protein BYT42DRAFT_615321 [Radiomyces spectabilis]
MENPNIHNVPYVRSRDQKRWKGHAKKVISKAETSERMRKWRAENRDKNKRNDLRCRVYRLARQKFGEQDSPEKQTFIREEIARRLGKRMLMEQREKELQQQRQQRQHEKQELEQDQSEQKQKQRKQKQQHHLYQQPQQEPTNQDWSCHSTTNTLVELPFYSAPGRKIELPSIRCQFDRWTPPSSPMSVSPILPHLSPCFLQRRTSSSSISSVGSIGSTNTSTTMGSRFSHSAFSVHQKSAPEDNVALPPMQSLLSGMPSPVLHPTPRRSPSINYAPHTKVLDEFVGFVLKNADPYPTA